jgi:predicted nucleic acid-binding protein
MPGDTRVRIFIDASVWIAAAGSPTGGSSLVLEICSGSRYVALCSQRVVLEAQTNIRAKLPTAALVRFYNLLAATSPQIVSSATSDDEAQYNWLVTPKDAHVIAAAVRGGARFLLSLDRKHLANDHVRGADLPFQVLTPGEFIQQFLGGTA